MKILAIADIEEPSLYDYYTPSIAEGVDLILSCGDLRAEYLEFLTTIVNRPLLYVRGNHDAHYDQMPPLGCDDIDDRIVTFQGIRILGLGGSMRYRPGSDQYSEEEMEKRIRHLRHRLHTLGGFDILVTHAPAKGYGDLADLAHQGFSCFNDLLNEYHPACMFYGHVHQSYSTDFARKTVHPSGAELINAYGHCYFEIEPKRQMEEKKSILDRLLHH